MPKKNKDLISKDLKKETEAVEKINKQEIKLNPVHELKERVLNIHFESYKDPLTKEIYDFIYNDAFKVDNSANVVKYILNLKKKLDNALNLRKLIKDFEITIFLNDNTTDPQDQDKLPRKMKLERLKQFYNTLLDMGLTLIHNFYWIDFDKKIESYNTLEECIRLATPLIFYLKDLFEESIHKEFKLTNEQLQILKN